MSNTSSLRDSTNLDFLRSVAVLLVFWVHLYDIWTGTGKNWGFVWHIGQLGVLMFFVHTCLVLMWSLERSSLEGWRLFISFYLRRAFRLYPLSIVCVLLAYYFDAHWEPVNLWQNLTLTQNLFFTDHPVFPPTLTPLWSLPLEVEMYAVLPLLFLIFRKRSVKLLAITWSVSVVMAFIQPELGDRFLILRYVPCFLGGVMAWRLMRERDRARLPAWLWPLGILTVSIIWMTATGKYLPLGIATFGLCLGLLIPLFREIPWSAVTTVSRLVARYSYGIYLTHFPIMVFVLSSPKDPRFKVIHQLPRLKHYARPVNLSLIVVLTAVASLALYHLIENPGIRVGQKVARWVASIYRQRVAPVTTSACLTPRVTIFQMGEAEAPVEQPPVGPI
jgi:peptidoglycan/LPS O-acetylase OafA/YrhL